MADLTKSLLDAISIIATKSADEVSSDKTIKATVKKIVSTSEGKYLVSYNNGTFYAYVQPGSTDLYQVDEQIYILVPAGDMSQKKFIVGKVKEGEERSSSKVLTSSLLNDYVTIGNNAILENTYQEEGIHVKRMQPLTLNSHKINDFYYCYLHNPDEVNDLLESKGISVEHDYDTADYPCLNIDDETFSNSAKQAEALLIRAKFKTAIDTNSIGNYGIIVNIAFADETNPQVDDDGNITYPPRTIAYVLDTSKMTGSPMKFYDYNSQYMIAAFDGEKYLYIDSIIAFSEGFVSEDTEKHSRDDDVNIYIDGLEIIALNEISAVNGDYKLKLTTPRGNTIRVGEKDSLKITAEVTYLNQDISKNTTFYWGVKDPSITSTSNDYNAKLGSGYKYLGNENKNELVLSAGNLTAAENIYICVAVYESNIILKTSVSLYNNNNKLDITIDSDQGTSFQFNEGNPVLTCLINGKDHNYQENSFDNAFSFIWSKEDAELGTIILNKTKAQLEAERDKELQECRQNISGLSNSGRSILQVTSYYSTQIAQIKDVSYPQGTRGPKISCKLKNVNTYVTYSCSVYRAGIYIGYGSITLQNSKRVINNNYYVTITNGSQVFQYDESGIAPNSQRNKEPIEVLDLTAVFHSPQGAEVTPKKVRWIVPEGKTLIKIPRLGLEIDPETGEKYFNGNIYPLDIKDIYDSNCNDNQLTAIVTHTDGTEYRQSTNLLFTKIGEIGTNGTNTTVKIDELISVQKDECLTLIKEKDNAFYNGYKDDISDKKASSNTSVLKANLYTNNAQTLGYTTKWTIAGTSKTQGRNYEVDSSGDDNNECIIRYNGDNSELDTRIVRAQINFGGKYFYSFYGLPAIEYLSEYTYDHYPIKIMRDGTLRTVLYDSSGTNPTYATGRGVHVELPWDNTSGFLDWEVEDNANFSLAKSPKLKKGSEKLEISTESKEIKAAILTAQDMGETCANEAPADIQKYINEFLADIERTILDNILPVSSKLESLWNRLALFRDSDNIPDKTNIFIKKIYEEYLSLFDKMKEEYDDCIKKNKEYSEKYNSIQNIWNSEWPEVITESRLHKAKGALQKIYTIQELIDEYKKIYNYRLDDEMNSDFSIDGFFDENFKNILDAYEWSFDDYDSILVEYEKVLMGYIEVLINETIGITTLLDDHYKLIYEDWDDNKAKYAEDIIGSSEENISNIFDSIRDLYYYYQKLFLDVKKNQIAEDSETLNIWNSLLNGQDPDLLKQIYVIPNDNFNGLYMDNNVIGTAYYLDDNDEKVEIAKIYVPIIMTLNTYELAALNGWDGTNVEVGDDHIMTPQVGAGIKDDTTNTFTGMVMGVVGNTAESKENDTFLDKANKVDKIGLIGYHNGQQSMFIDAKTGKATFGLPSEDNGFDEGRIELNPGGVSKIGNWKIGNRFLYNIVDGTYELRKDIDANPSHKESKIMVPHDKHGIVLSSDQPYIHVKGEVYEDKNLSGINYEDEYNNINPGDSLELRMDSGNSSLFSIIQHTSGFGDEDVDGLFFGYKSVESDDNKIIIKNYVANQNIEEYGTTQNSGKAAYYIYKLKTDGNNQYLPYYQEEKLENSSISKIDNSWVSEIKAIEGNKKLSDNLTETTNFEKGNVFNINEDTGVITYNSNRLNWKKNVENNWQSVTEEIESADDFSITFRYNKTNTSLINNDINIGQLKIKEEIADKFYKIKIKNCNISYQLTGINLNDSSNNYIQFYIVLNDEDVFENALLKSEQIRVQNDLSMIDIELFSSNKEKYLQYDENNIYYLKMKTYFDDYVIDTDCSCTVSKLSNSVKRTMPVAPYGKIEIKNTTYQGTYGDFDVLDGFGKYRYYYDTEAKKYNFQVILFANKNSNGTSEKSFTYDFVLWNSDGALAGGRATSIKAWSSSVPGKDWGRIFTIEPTKWDKLSNHIFLDVAPSNINPCYISFYPTGYCTEDIIEYELEQEGGSAEEGTSGIQEDIIVVSVTTDPVTGRQIITEETLPITSGDPDIVVNSTTENVNPVIKYKLINENVLSMNAEPIYDTIHWNWNIESDMNYENDVKAFWNLKINADFGEIVGFKPINNASILCIEGDSFIDSLQGIPFSVTYWDNNNEKIKFYKNYYDYINEKDSNRSQYGYIDIDVDIDDNNNNIYYKYIKTVPKTFIEESLENNIFIEKNYNELQNKIIWKEFVRVGLDENGRFFSAGLQDKKTYGRTGKIYSFGKVPDLYGQEVRLESSLKNYQNIIKIFSQQGNKKNLKTTYITQGKDDDGNINIRTSNDGYLKFGVSQYSSNNTNTIPDEINYIKIDYEKGLDVQINHGNGIINLKNNLSIITDSLLVQNSMSNFKWIITNNGIQIKSSSYILSSLNNNNNSITENDYRIKIVKGSSNFTPMVKLEIGKNNTEFNFIPNKIILRASKDKYLEINGQITETNCLSIDAMRLNFDSKNQIVSLKNGNKNYIQLDSNNIILQTGQNKIIIGSEIVLKGSENIAIQSSSVFDRDVLVKMGLYANKNLYVGYNNKEKKSTTGAIYLYENDTNNYLKITAKDLKQLFDWYNNYRWAIGCYGNTVIMRNVKNKISPEGQEISTLENDKWRYRYSWDYKTFSNYYK